VQKLSKYVLITPARDEAAFIELTIQSVIQQTLLPVKWVIVSDGSTDGTDDIVRKYSTKHTWIELLRMPKRHDRSFSGKAYAFNTGYALMKELEYEVIANLDGDLSFDRDYFAFLLGKMSADSSLGVVGTPFEEKEGEPFYDYSIVGLDHVSGACQLFRRQCFEEIGGYVPMRLGGIDYVALTTARMKGWKTRTFTEKVSHHHRKMGSAQTGVLKSRYKLGLKDYVFGGHPLWEVFRAFYQMTKKPFIVGGLALAAGYFLAAIRREERPISPEMIAFRRREQMLRLRKLVGFSPRPLAAR
jgi:poly-beta-1,6-N-acetyl-D-glucosamine synthase